MAPPARPAAPTTDNREGRVVVRWVNPPDTATARLRWRRAPDGATPSVWLMGGFTPQSPGPNGINAISLVDSIGVRHEFQVQVRNAAEEESDWSPGAYGTPQAPPPPAAPDTPATPTFAVGVNAVTVRWVNPARTATVNIRRRVRNTHAWTETTGRTGTSYTFASLVGGTEYEFQVQAVNAGGESDWSASGYATPTVRTVAPARPAAPTTSPSTNAVVVSWIKAAGTVTTNLRWRVRNSGSSWSQRSGQTDASETVSGLVGGTEYEFQVQAVNSAGSSDWSPSGYGTPSVPAIAPGKSPTPSLSLGNNRTIVVTYQNPSSTGSASINRYDVRYRRRGTTSWTTRSNVGASPYTTPSLTANTEYEVEVRAGSTAGLGAWSDAARITVPAQTNPLAAPSGIVLTPGAGTIQVRWTVTSDPTNLRLDYLVRHREQGGGWTTIATGSPYTIEGLSRGVTYDVQVGARAQSAGNPVTWSATHSTITPVTTSSAPLRPLATAGDESVNLQWATPSDNGGAEITAYDVQWKLATATAWTTIDNATTGARSYTVLNLTNDSEYDFRIRAITSAGNGAWSAEVSATPESTGATVVIINPPADEPDAEPDAIAPGRGVIVSIIGRDNELEVTWQAPSDEGTYVVESYDVRIRSGVEWTLIDEASVDLMHTIPGLQNNREYQVQVRAVSQAGPGLWSEIAKGIPSSARAPVVGLLKILSIRDRVWGITEDGRLFNTFDLSQSWEQFASIPKHETPVLDMLIFRHPTGAPTIFVLTVRGMWYLDWEISEFLPLSVKFPRSLRNGKGAAVWREDLYIPVGMSVLRYTGGQNPVLTAVGPDQEQGFPWDGSHQIVKLEATNNALLAVVQNIEEDPATAVGTSHLLAYNGTGWWSMWTPDEYEVLNDVLVTTIFGEYSAWIGYGDIAVIDLPIDIINPHVVNAERRFGNDDEAITPWFNADEAELYKLALRVKATASNMTETEVLGLDYALDYSEDWTSLGDINVDGISEFSLADQEGLLGIPFNAIRFRIRARRGVNAMLSPDLNALSLEFQKRLDRRARFTVRLDMSRPVNGLAPSQQRAALEEAQQSLRLVPFTIRSAEVETFHVEVENVAYLEWLGTDTRGQALVTLVEL